MPRLADPLEIAFAAAIRDRTPAELEALALKSPAIHFACFCTIRDKNNDLIAGPTPNILQLRISEAYETLTAMGVKVRIIVTKPRRAGCSTFCAHVLYHHGMRKPCEGIAIADKKEHSEALLEKLKSYTSTDAYPWETPMISDPSFSIEWANGTKWTVDTAQNPNASVGDTNTLGLFSEVSKWPKTTQRNDADVMAAVLPTLSGSATVAFSESTPEGAVGFQHDTWKTAVTLEEFIRMHEAGIRPEEQWVKVFAAWFEFADNRRKEPITPEEAALIEATLEDDERAEREKYGLDYEQIAWRREIIKNVCKADKKKFSYYYPSNDIDCWLASGSPRFDMQVLAEMQQIASSQTPEVGHLVPQGRSGDGPIVFQRANEGLIYIWERPAPRLRYLVALDPATDKSQTVGADPDRHSLKVWRAGYHDTANNVWRNAKVVARLKPPFYGEGDEVAAHAVRLCKFYGHCIFWGETNMGLDIVRQVKAAGIAVGKRHPLSHRTGETIEQFGFRLKDEQERNAIIEGLAAAIRERRIDIPCAHTMGEYMRFIRKPNGRAEAASGAHDDDVMSDAMAWESMVSATEYSVHKAQNVDPPDLNSWRTVNAVRRGY